MAKGNKSFFLCLCFIQESQDGFVVEINVCECGEKTVDHQSVCFFCYMVPVSFSNVCKSDQSAGQFILKLGGIGFLSTYTGISRTASTAGCLFTLKTKHFFVHVSILRFSYFEI